MAPGRWWAQAPTLPWLHLLRAPRCDPGSLLAARQSPRFAGISCFSPSLVCAEGLRRGDPARTQADLRGLQNQTRQNRPSSCNFRGKMLPSFSFPTAVHTVAHSSTLRPRASLCSSRPSFRVSTFRVARGQDHVWPRAPDTWTRSTAEARRSYCTTESAVCRGVRPV